MKKKFSALFVALTLLLGLNWINLAKAGVSTAEGTLKERLKAGKLIEPGEYVGERLNNKEADYYKIKVKPGQQIKIYGSGELGEGKTYMASFRLTLYNNEGTILSTNQVEPYRDPAEAKTASVFYLPGTTDISPQTKDNLAYFEVYFQGEDDTYWLKNYSFRLALDKEKTDIGSGTDAGDSFDLAQEIKAGNYPKNSLAKNKCGINKYCSTDHKDVFKILVKAKEKLTVKVTPNQYLQPKVDFFNELKEDQEGGKAAANKGAAVEASYISPEDQEVYFVVSSASYEDWYYGSYALDVSVEEATAKELEEAGIVEETPVAEETPKEEIPKEETTAPENEMLTVTSENKIPEAIAQIPQAENFISKIRRTFIWLLIGVAAFIAVIVTIVSLVLRSKKKPSRPSVVSPRPSASLPEVPAKKVSPEVPKPPKIPKPPSEEGTSGMILPPKELKGK